LIKYQINHAEKTVDELSAALTQLIVRENFDRIRLEDNASVLGLSPDSFIRRITTVSVSASRGGGLGITVRNIQKMTNSYWRYLRNRPNTSVFNAGAIFLGLVIAMGTLIQQQRTETFYVFEWKNILLLLTLGAGADSVKQIVERVFYKET
jgi:AraC-like DNA-binding protein